MCLSVCSLFSVKLKTNWPGNEARLLHAKAAQINQSVMFYRFAK